jgi:hypothetical protein
LNRRQYIVDVISNLVGNSANAEMVIERLEQEGVIHLGYGDAEVDQIVDKFTSTFGSTKTTKYDRFAAHRLAAKYGSQAICGLIGLLGEHSVDKYAPVVNNLVQWEEKMPSILNFLRSTDGEEIQV